MTKILNIKTFSVFLTFLVLITTNLQAAPEVLEKMPANATVVAVSKPISELNTKIDLFVRQIGIPIQEPIDLKDMVKLPGFPAQRQIDSGRPMAMTMLNILDPKNSIAIYLPVNDAAAILEAIPEKQALADGVYKLQDDVNLMADGDYLVFSPSSITLTTIKNGPKGAKLSSADSEIFESGDIAANINLTTVMPILKGMALGKIAQIPEIQNHPARVKLANMIIDRVTEFEGLGLALTLAPENILIDMNFKAIEGSKLASVMQNHPTISPSALSKLPDGNFMLAYAVEMDTDVLTPAINAVIDTLAEDAEIQEKLGAENIAAIKDIMAKSTEICSTGIMAQYMPENTDPTQPTMQTMMGISKSKDSDKLMEYMSSISPAISNLMKSFGLDIAMDFKPDAGTVAGKEYGELTVDMSQMDMPQEALDALAAQWGGQAMFTEQLAKIDDKHVAFGTGGGLEKLLTFDSVGANSLDQNEQIKKLTQVLPKKANVYMFMNAGNMMQASMSNPNMPMEAQMMMGMLSQVKGTVAASKVVDDGLARVKLVIPNELIQSGVMAAMTFQMQMQMQMQQMNQQQNN